MGRMSATKMCILIIITSGWQCEVGTERFKPYQSENHRRLHQDGNAKLGEGDLHPISPKTPDVSNCFVNIKMITTESTQ